MVCRISLVLWASSERSRCSKITWEDSALQARRCSFPFHFPLFPRNARSAQSIGAERKTERSGPKSQMRWLNLPLMAAKTCCPLYSRTSAFCSLQFTSVTVIKAGQSWSYLLKTGVTTTVVVATRFLEYPVNLGTWLFLKPSIPGFTVLLCFKMGYSALLLPRKK